MKKIRKYITKAKIGTVLLILILLIYMCKNNGNLMNKEKFNDFEKCMVLEKIKK